MNKASHRVKEKLPLKYLWVNIKFPLQPQGIQNPNHTNNCATFVPTLKFSRSFLTKSLPYLSIACLVTNIIKKVCINKNE
mmetsp:Transcript_31889/g.28241  ORF Transcript_31889/g.28241 Transcript_31889/m.28241 type:complete len:80 (-) Transcript_31889:156-395(-)